MNPGLALEDAVIDWSPTTVFEPIWSTDQAAEFRSRWAAVITR